MTTKEAFLELTNERGWHVKIGLSDSTGRSYAKRFRDGKLSMEKLEAILEQAGYKVIQEKLWQR